MLMCGYSRNSPCTATYPCRSTLVAEPTVDPERLGCTMNHATPDRMDVSPAILMPVFNAPTSSPLMYSVSCMASQSVAILPLVGAPTPEPHPPQKPFGVLALGGKA